MKIVTKLVLLLLLCSVSLELSAICRRELRTKNLDAYVGTWQYIHETETLKITLRKVPENSTFSYGECLVGNYYYKKGNTVLDPFTDADIPTESNDATWKTIIIFATNFIDKAGVCEKELAVMFRDKRKKKSTTGRIDLLSPIQIKWVINEVEGVYSDDEAIPEDGFSIPVGVVLTKVVPAKPPVGGKVTK